MPAPTRCLVVWFPDWPVTAWLRAQGKPPGEPVAVVGANQVVSCSGAAREAGVWRGQRRREAQAACPDLVVVPADSVRDQRVFEPLIARLEELSPGVWMIRPGLVAIRARGPSRYYGGEVEAANALLDGLVPLGMIDVRVGVADGVFTAEQAAYAAEPVLVVPPGESASFLAPLPVNRLGDDDLSGLLPRLGVRRLGEFAAMNPAAIRDRFGERGVRLHALAAGADSRPVVPRVPPQDLACQVEFEPPLALADQVAFAVRATAGRFVAGLAAARLVCTELRVRIVSERGESAERVWLHPAAFDEAAVTDRVRWQLQAAAGVTVNAPVCRVVLEPAAVDASAHHEPGLFGTGPDERVHHTLSRVQAMLGHAGVVTASIGGGRWLAERQVLVPWGDRPVVPYPADQPWPGHLPAPFPAAVFPVPRPVDVLSSGGARVGVDDRGMVSAAPALLVDEDERRRVASWAGPWPIDERTWDPDRHRSACRFQVVDAAQGAWLLVLDDGGEWWAEGRYD